MSFCDTHFDLPTMDIQEPHGLEAKANEDADEAIVCTEPFYPTLNVDEDDFKCSICLYLWHKPCMSSCGHIFCFWCIHLAMNGMGSSQCPLCRTPFTHLPSICAPLHHFVQLQFPTEAHQRALEVGQEEQVVGVQSPSLPPPPRYGVFEEEFNCLLCGRLAYEPTVTTCGHLFCRGCVQALTAEGPVNCPEPHCAGFLKAAPSVCLVLHELLQAALPQPYAARAREAATEVGTPLSRSPEVALLSLKPQPPKPFCPIEEVEAAQQDPNYMHFGIICDSCGAYPIVGHRWRCQDCPEKIGFDICGDCHTRQVHRQVSTGKFNQSHEPSHRMMLVDQVNDWLHQLKAMHPELSVEQLMSLVALALDGLQQDGQQQAQPGAPQIEAPAAAPQDQL